MISLRIGIPPSVRTGVLHFGMVGNGAIRNGGSIRTVPEK